MDKVDKDKRSEVMSHIRGKNTTVELKLRKILYANGYRYRLHHKKLIGHPDIYLGKYKTAIFVNGCFWHRHQNCKLSSQPKSNIDFWESKFQRNIERDISTYQALNKASIKVIIVWECSINKLRNAEDVERFLLELSDALNGDQPLQEI